MSDAEVLDEAYARPAEVRSAGVVGTVRRANTKRAPIATAPRFACRRAAALFSGCSVPMSCEAVAKTAQRARRERLDTLHDPAGVRRSRHSRAAAPGRRRGGRLTGECPDAGRRGPARCVTPLCEDLAPRRRGQPAHAGNFWTRHVGSPRLPPAQDSADHLQPRQHDHEQAGKVDQPEDEAELPEISLADKAAAVIHRRGPRGIGRNDPHEAE